MIAQTKCTRQANAPHPVTTVLAEIAAEEITVELVRPEDEPRWNKLMRQHHYLKEHRLVGESLRYVAQQNGRWIALLGWSSAAYHLGPRDAWIGWTAAQRQAERHWLACNARFALLSPKAHSPNLASHLLGLNLQRLSQDWLVRYGHPILLVESYVDPQRFEGTCYRAANWIEIGVTKGFGRSRLDFYQLHEHPKAIFVYPLHPRARQMLPVENGFSFGAAGPKEFRESSAPTTHAAEGYCGRPSLTGKQATPGCASTRPEPRLPTTPTPRVNTSAWPASPTFRKSGRCQGAVTRLDRWGSSY